jgi:hypothetical protein
MNNFILQFIVNTNALSLLIQSAPARLENEGLAASSPLRTRGGHELLGD